MPIYRAAHLRHCLAVGGRIAWAASRQHVRYAFVRMEASATSVSIAQLRKEQGARARVGSRPGICRERHNGQAL